MGLFVVRSVYALWEVSSKVSVLSCDLDSFCEILIEQVARLCPLEVFLLHSILYELV